jgi:hypothetical protein
MKYIFRNYKTFGRQMGWEGSLKIQGREERILLGCVDVYGFHLAQDWDQEQDIVNTAMKLRIQ